MTEPEELAELNRLISGELPDRQALELMKRMLRDNRLRTEYQRLEQVDALVKDAYLGDESSEAEDDESEESESSAGGPARTGGATVSPERRQDQIDAILGRIEGRRRLHRRRPARAAFGWARRQSPAPWLVAASLALVCGYLLHAAYPLEQRFAPPEELDGLSSDRIAQYIAAKKQLSPTIAGVVWGDDLTTEMTMEDVAAPVSRDVILRVTVFRYGDGGVEQWQREAAIRRGHVMNLATRDNRIWPVSVEVNPLVGGQRDVRIRVQARLTDNPPAKIDNQVTVTSGKQVFVGAVSSNGVRYELYIEAVPVSEFNAAV